ncbi:MAG: hypothetical protein Q9213_006608 [Squamulea squamosa]
MLAVLSTKVFSHDGSQSVLAPDSGLAEGVEHCKAKTHQILLSVADGPSIIPADLELHEASLGYMSLQKSLELAKVKALELDLKQRKAAFYAASAIGFFAPEILSIPALEALGFSFAGVRAGTLASKIQSVIGPVAARSVFAIWQSARMGGYGVEYVNGGVRALIALADATVAACNPLKDCKGLISDAGQRLGDSSARTALAVVCGCLAVLSSVFG